MSHVYIKGIEGATVWTGMRVVNNKRTNMRLREYSYYSRSLLPHISKNGLQPILLPFFSYACSGSRTPWCIPARIFCTNKIVY